MIRRRRSIKLNKVKLKNVLVVGVGGQGVVTLGNFFQDYASKDPRIPHFVATESRGVSQREGSVYALIRYIFNVLDGAKKKGQQGSSDIPTIAPVIPKGKVDLIIALEPLEFLRYIDFLSPTGICVINLRRLIPKSIVTKQDNTYPDINAALKMIEKGYPNIEIIAEDFTSQVEELNSPLFMVNKLILQKVIDKTPEFLDINLLKSLIQAYFH
jgi:Pyruvate/2-oxoacid:ferredoxin oxidoreductase gamma subunit